MNVYVTKKIAGNKMIENMERNNFDFLRFVLAISVIYSHCYVIYYARLIDTEPGMVLTKNQTDIGGIAVNFFFVISGFLILRSFLHSRTTLIYLKKRILRIYPGFFFAFIISILIVAPLATAYDNKVLNIGTYFQTLNIKKFLLNLFTMQSPVAGKCFVRVPLHGMVNESLWTIEYEFFCYLLLPFLALINALKHKWIIIVLFITAYISLAIQNLYPGLITVKNFPTIMLYILNPILLPRFIVYFLAGACFYLYNHKIGRSKQLALLSIIAILISCIWGKALDLVLPFAGTYLLFYIAFHPRINLSSFAKNGDLSYGIYLYAWPIQ